jgi:hypothetical protein
MRGRDIFHVIVWILVGSALCHAQKEVCPAVGREPLSVEGNAPIIMVQFKRPDGTRREARFVLDSGGGAVLLDSNLASELGLRTRGSVIEESGERYAPIDLPQASIGGLAVSFDTSKAFVHLGTRSFDSRERVEGLLPGKALEPYQVVLDYPKGLFTIAPSGCIKHVGTEMDSPFLPASGHPRVTLRELNKEYGFLLDTGARVTLARRDLIESWIAAHPDWPSTTGASGTADMPGGDGKELLLRVPEIVWGSFHIEHVLIVSRPDQTFSQSSFETPEAIIGALGGNVLDGFRIEIDYPHGKTYLEQVHQPDANDMNSAGLVLDVNSENQLVVRAISATADQTTKDNVHPGDVIVKIGDKSYNPWTITEASQALSGIVGQKRQLLIRRNGVEIQASVVISHLI